MKISGKVFVTFDPLQFIIKKVMTTIRILSSINPYKNLEIRRRNCSVINKSNS